MIGSLGENDTKGVEAEKIRMEYDGGLCYYSFSLRNHLQETVTSIRCMVVFYDEDGSPIDTKKPAVSFWSIAPGLAKRIEKMVTSSSIKDMMMQGQRQRPGTRIEVRILDFEVER